MSKKKMPLLMEQAAPNYTAQAILDGTWLPRTVFVADDGHFILASDVLLEMVSEAGLIHSPGDVVTRVNELIHGLVEAGCEIRYGVGTAVPPAMAPAVWQEQGTFIPMSPEDAATTPWDHYGFIPCSQVSYNDRRGDETLALWVLVGPDQIYPVHPRGPYGVEVETYSGQNWCISLYHVALKQAVRDHVHGMSALYRVTITKHFADVISGRRRKQLLAGIDPEGKADEVHKTSYGWMVIQVEAPGRDSRVNPADQQWLVTFILRPQFWEVLGQQERQPSRLDIDEDEYREWCYQQEER